MNRIVLSAALLLALPLAAQTPKPPQEPPKPAAPVISDAQRAEFFKAQSQMIQANTQASQMQAEFQRVTGEISKTCGDNYTAQLNQSGDPVCVAKSPTPPKK